MISDRPYSSVAMTLGSNSRLIRSVLETLDWHVSTTSHIWRRGCTSTDRTRSLMVANNIRSALRICAWVNSSDFPEAFSDTDIGKRCHYRGLINLFRIGVDRNGLLLMTTEAQNLLLDSSFTDWRLRNVIRDADRFVEACRALLPLRARRKPVLEQIRATTLAIIGSGSPPILVRGPTGVQ